MNRPASIALIDLSYLFKKRFHTTTITGHMAAAKAVLQDLAALGKDVGHTILCLDAPPYEHRKAIYSEYKANRPAPEPEEKAQRAWLYKEVQAEGFSMARCQGYEADDVIATLAKKYSEWCNDVRIVCPDKDAAQCVTSSVTQYIPPVGDRDWEVRDPMGVEKKFGVTPALMPLYQALMGDASDNVPGVKGIGAVKAAKLVNKYPSLAMLAHAVADTNAGGEASVDFKSLAVHWESLVMSLKLVTLDTNVPLDAEALLVPATPTVISTGELEPANDVEPEQEEEPTDAELQEYLNHPDHRVSMAAELLANPPKTFNPKAEENRQRLAASLARTAPTYTQTKYGLVTADLQPLDLDSASTLAKWFHAGGLYGSKFKSEAEIFTILAKARELGLKMTIALDNYHVIEGKPSASADLVRALAEKDPSFEYLYPREMSPTKATWVGKRKGYPDPVTLSYTIEEAKAAGLVRSGNYGKPGNWEKRPQDMLVKTAGSKLARLLWPAAVMGLYCFEEMGYSQEELDAREAA
jgi:5'-3' exonuclease